MSESEPSKVFMFDNSDPEMQQAYQKARSTFRYFWREVAWERRRIVPALDLACVKAPFSDGPNAKPAKDHPNVEHMWLDEVDFDGQFVSGVLLNDPNWLKSVTKGDSARLPLGETSDWMYAISGVVYGAYTVNVMRSRMGRQERKEHDDAWGMDFGDPSRIRVVPEWNKKRRGLLWTWFGGKSKHDDLAAEHPLSGAMASKLKEKLAENPTLLHAKDDHGWTLLHNQALAGSAAMVTALLDCGADPNAVTVHGMTPLRLAKSLGWDKVVAILASKGAK